MPRFIPLFCLLLLAMPSNSNEAGTPPVQEDVHQQQWAEFCLTTGDLAYQVASYQHFQAREKFVFRRIARGLKSERDQEFVRILVSTIYENSWSPREAQQQMTLLCLSYQKGQRSASGT